MPRKQYGGIMDTIKEYANKATAAAKDGLDAAKSAAGMEDDEEKKRKQRAAERARMHAAHATAPAPVGPVPSSTPAQLGGRKRRRGGRKGGRKGGRRTRKAGMCGVCGAGGSRKGGRKTKRKRGGKKTHKKRKGRSGLGSVKKMVERYF